MWILYSLAAALVWGIDYAFAEKILERMSTVTFLAMQLTFGAVVLWIWSAMGPLKDDIRALERP